MTAKQKERYLAIKATKERNERSSDRQRFQSPRLGYVSVGHGAYRRAMQDAGGDD